MLELYKYIAGMGISKNLPTIPYNIIVGLCADTRILERNRLKEEDVLKDFYTTNKFIEESPSGQNSNLSLMRHQFLEFLV
jgi:hypothetical protein